MSLLDEFLEASSRSPRQCTVSDLLDLLDETDPDRAEILRAALDDRRVTAPGLEVVVARWKIDDAPAIKAQTFQRHRNGVCCRGD